MAQTIKLAFDEVGGDFDNPAKESLARAVEVLAKKARAWGTPTETVEHNRGQIQRALDLLK